MAYTTQSSRTTQASPNRAAPGAPRAAVRRVAPPASPAAPAPPAANGTAGTEPYYRVAVIARIPDFHQCPVMASGTVANSGRAPNTIRQPIPGNAIEAAPVSNTGPPAPHFTFANLPSAASRQVPATRPMTAPRPVEAAPDIGAARASEAMRASEAARAVAGGRGLGGEIVPDGLVARGVEGAGPLWGQRDLGV